jgi:hypothetical protein
MISVITSARNPMSQTIQERNIAKTVGVDHEYLLYDNSSGAYSLASIYNQAASEAKGDFLVFIHDDVFFMKMDWGKIVEALFMKDQYLSCAGVAGTQYLFADNPSLTAAGRPFIKGRTIHDMPNGDFFAVVFSKENGTWEVVACGGLFMAMPRSLFGTIRFDETTFDKDCFHDLDICMQLHTMRYRILVTTDIVVKKRSSTVFDKTWQEYGKRFLDKWAGALPASCTDQIPDAGPRQSSQIVNLKGKYSQETIT